MTDHSDYDYPEIVRKSKLVVDTRNATKGIQAPNLVRCWIFQQTGRRVKSSMFVLLS